MPPVTLEQLRKKLDAKQPPACVLLLGSESFLREKCRALLIERTVPEGAREWAVAKLSARDTELDRVLQQAQMMPMLSPAQAIVVSDLEAWQKGGEVEGADAENDGDDGKPRPAAASRRLQDDDERNSLPERLAEYLAKPAPFTLLILEAVNLDQRKKLFKVLSEHALLVTCEFSDSRDADERLRAAIAATAELLPQIARDAGVSLSPNMAARLADACNGDVALARTEVQKLATYLGSRTEIRAADIEKLVVNEREHSVWQFATILAQSDRPRALEFLDGVLAAGEQPPAIVGAMAWIYRTLLQVQEFPAGMSQWQVMGKLRMRPDTAELALREARRIPRERLVTGLAALYEADNRLKLGNKDSRAVLEFLVAQLTA